MEEEYEYQRQGWGDPVAGGGGGFMKAIVTTGHNLPGSQALAGQALSQAAGIASGQMAKALGPKVAGGAAKAAGGGLGKMMSGGGGGGFAQVAEGLAGIAGGLVGGRARRREQREAREELKRARADYEQFEFKDPTANMTNPFEDMTVNQQQAQFESQQQQQALAGTLSGLSAAAGGSGIGALAQSLAQQQATNLQRSAASIGMQESQQQMTKAQGAQTLQAARAEGAKYVQDKEFGRTEDIYNTAAARKAAADEARKKATEGLIGGVANVAVGAARIATTGGM